MKVNAVLSRFAGERRLERGTGDRQAGELRAWINRPCVLTAIDTRAEGSDEKSDGQVSCGDGGAASHDGPNLFLLLDNLSDPATCVDAKIRDGYYERGSRSVYPYLRIDKQGTRMVDPNWPGQQIGSKDMRIENGKKEIESREPAFPHSPPKALLRWRLWRCGKDSPYSSGTVCSP